MSQIVDLKTVPDLSLYLKDEYFLKDGLPRGVASVSIDRLLPTYLQISSDTVMKALCEIGVVNVYCQIARYISYHDHNWGAVAWYRVPYNTNFPGNFDYASSREFVAAVMNVMFTDLAKESTVAYTTGGSTSPTALDVPCRIYVDPDWSLPLKAANLFKRIEDGEFRFATVEEAKSRLMMYRLAGMLL